MSLERLSDSSKIDRSKLPLTRRKCSLTCENEDVLLSKGPTPDSGCFDGVDDLDTECLDKTGPELETLQSDEQMRHIAKAIEAISLESITSGISSGSCASEDRLDLLRCVSSISNLCSRPPADTSCHSKRRARSSLNRKSEESNELFNKKKCSFTCDLLPGLRNFRDQHRRKSMTAVSIEDETKCDDSFKNVSNSCNAKYSLSRQQSVTTTNEDNDGLKKCSSNKELRRTDSKYDPTLEKSKTFLHGQGKTFSRANEYLTPARPGLQKLQVSYTQTNTENNYRKIFFDLVKTAHRQNIIVSETVRNLERRLFFRRSDPHRATSYFENKGLRDPSRHYRKKMARTTADKINERKEKIKQTSDEIKIGYIPREQTIVLPGPEDIDKLRNDCRYLRVHPKLTDT
ncbi:uncharacterized protein LOC117323511 [Pecten maximus]|uniref:uncharacterized protein LOC117323511 n=1 Tax=Pecten maximus TaxID=6579 RepID=UPI00145912AA|nr:uncharacterized protein LOC117323511 [Pecten maximus]